MEVDSPQNPMYKRPLSTTTNTTNEDNETNQNNEQSKETQSQSTQEPKKNIKNKTKRRKTNENEQEQMTLEKQLEPLKTKLDDPNNTYSVNCTQPQSILERSKKCNDNAKMVSEYTTTNDLVTLINECYNDLTDRHIKRRFITLKNKLIKQTIENPGEESYSSSEVSTY